MSTTDQPEMQSVAAFVSYLKDDDRSSVTIAEIEALSVLHKRPYHAVRTEFLSLNVLVVSREPERRVRGINTSNHDLHFGPGSCKSHGGSGGDQITGFAGQSH